MVLSDREFRALLDLFMCDDPSVLEPEPRDDIRALLDVESRYRGFEDWIYAFHYHMKENIDA